MKTGNKKTVKTDDLTYRSLTLVSNRSDGVPSTLDEETRSVEVIGATEAPVEVYDWERGIIKEVLLMDGIELPKNRQIPLLDNHSRWSNSSVLGSYRDMEVSGGQLLGRAYFSSAPEVESTYTKVREGHLTDFSVGYRVIKAVWVPEGQTQKVRGNSYKGPVKVTTRWRVKELSSTPFGADQNAKARSEMTVDPQPTKLMEQIKMDENERKALTDQIRKDIEKEFQQKAREDIERANAAHSDSVKEILALGDAHGMEEDARKAIEDGKTVDQFRAQVLSFMEKRHNAKPVNTGSQELGLTPDEKKRFSFMNAIRFLADPGNAKAREGAAFEIEVSRAYEDANRKTARGLIIPPEVLTSRAMSTETLAAGGALVDDKLLAGSFIESLENTLVIKAMGCIILRDLVGDLTIPKQTGGATAYWIGEGDDITESQQALGQVALKPMGIGAFTDLTRKFMLQSSIDAEAFVRNDLALRLGLAIDAAALNGSGASGQPLGILNTTGIGAKTLATANTPTFGECVDIETEIATDNALVGSLAYTANATIAGNMKQTDVGTDTGRFILQKGLVNDYRFLRSNQVPAKYLLFGNWRDLILGYWSGIDVNVDTASLSKSGGLRVVVIQDIDVALRHPESFAYGYKA